MLSFQKVSGKQTCASSRLSGSSIRFQNGLGVCSQAPISLIYKSADTCLFYGFAWELIFFFCTFVIGMKPRVVLPVQALLVVGLLSACLHAQSVGIGTATPHSSARLHIEDNARGLLIPNVALTGTNDVTTVSNPALSLLVYNTNTATGPTAVTPGFYYWNGSRWVRLLGGGDAWLLTGNAGTNPATNFLGTTDAQPLCIRVDNQETFRFNPPGTSAPAWSIQRGGGNPRGLHAVDLQSARAQATQVASGDYSVIGGGRNNTASGSLATVGGGEGNTAGELCTVGGGFGNTAGHYAATVGGGRDNNATIYATVGGGRANSASNFYATVGGGRSNTATYAATVGGGWNNTANAPFATVGGGYVNTVVSGDAATVGGGHTNTVSGFYATVGGGFGNTAGNFAATVGGGRFNTASDTSATVGGGGGNRASGQYATVGGGSQNTASSQYATVGGGRLNTASDTSATVGGGLGNTASGQYATVGGGRNNVANGNFSAIPGGYNLQVGTRSFGFSGQTSVTQTDLSANSNIAAFVDVNLWLYSRDFTNASQLRFYGAQAHSSGANYVALRAPTSLSANTTYTLPASAPATSAAWLQSDNTGAMSWRPVFYGTVSVDPPNINANTSTTFTVTITGVQSGDLVFLTPPSDIEEELIFQGADVTAANTVTIRMRNVTVAAVDGASLEWSYMVIRP